jgi:Tol biopolymer transport system component
VFSSDRLKGQAHLYAQQVDSAAPPQQLTDKLLSEREVAGSWLPDGKTLAITSRGTRAFDIMTLHIEGTETASWKPQSPTPLLNADFSEQAPAFSPDGRWLAYISNETGRNEVYVRRFPELDGREQISSDGGALPTWSHARKELFYTSVGAIRVVEYAPSGAEFRPGKSRVWAQLPLANIDGVRNYDLHPDGERMVILQPAATPEGVARDTVILEMNFQEELRRVTP